MRLSAKIIATITASSVFAAVVTGYAGVFMASNGAENIGLWVTGVGVLVVLAVLNFAVLVSRLSTRRVQIAQVQLQELAKGKTDFVVREDNQQDEISDIQKSIGLIRTRMVEQKGSINDPDSELKALNIKTAQETDVSLNSPDIQANSLKNTAEIMRFAAMPTYDKDNGDWDDV
jgi:hypothetical protein